MKITRDMVGLEIHRVRGAPSSEFNEFTIHLTLKEISDEGLDMFGLTEDDIQS